MMKHLQAVSVRFLWICLFAVEFDYSGSYLAVGGSDIRYTSTPVFVIAAYVFVYSILVDSLTNIVISGFHRSHFLV